MTADSEKDPVKLPLEDNHSKTESHDLDQQEHPAVQRKFSSTTGQVIRNARIKLRTSLEKMSKETKIRVKYLQAIEDDNFAIIPEKVAARGFIKICSEYLGLNPQDILQQFSTEQGEERPLKVSINKTSLPNPVIVFTGIAALGVLLIVLVFLWMANNPRTEYTKPKKSKDTEYALNLSEIMPSINLETQLPKDEESVPKMARLTVKALRDAWIKVTVDNNDIFHGMLSKGKTKTWYGKETVSIRSPDPQRVQLIFNDKDVGQLGTSKKVTEKTFSAEVIR